MAATSTTPSSPITEVPLSREVLNQLFALMLRTRMLAAQHRSDIRINEALISGTLPNLESTDIIVTASPAASLQEMNPAININGREQSRVVVAEADLATGIGSGLAAGLRLAGSSSVAVVLLPGKATSNKAAQMALKFNNDRRDLPMVIVADWTESRLSSRNHDGQTLSRWPFPTIAVDGRDVIAVYRVTKEAITAARRGFGPTLVDCVNFLAPGGRGRDQRDPLASFKSYLQRHNAWSDEWFAELQAKLKAEISASRELSRKSNRRR